MADRVRFMVKVNEEWVPATKHGYPIVCERWQLPEGAPVVSADDADFYVSMEELTR